MALFPAGNVQDTQNIVRKTYLYTNSTGSYNVYVFRMGNFRYLVFNGIKGFSLGTTVVQLDAIDRPKFNTYCIVSDTTSSGGKICVLCLNKKDHATNAGGLVPQMNPPSSEPFFGQMMYCVESTDA